MITGRDLVKLGTGIRNQTGEYIQAASGALRVSGRVVCLRQCQGFHQWHDVDTIALQHRTTAEIDLVHCEAPDTVHHGLSPAGEK